jgi:hypothetical protein
MRDLVSVVAAVGLAVAGLGCNSILGNNPHETASAGGAPGTAGGSGGSGSGGSGASGGTGGASCTNMCTAGATQCQPGNSLQTCGTVNGCLAYTAAACGSGLVCERDAPASCADPSWAEWPIPNDAPDVAAGAPNPESYAINGDGTVTDKVTGLTWQQTPPPTTYTWSAAVDYCTTLTLGGYTDWRLPTKIELLSIVDYSVASPGPLINATAFPGTPSRYFWSSTPLAGSSSSPWSVSFLDGGATSADGVTNTYGVRCVR